ncbi:hypothetical protein FACS1894137_13260 [Spirochaetia bacterium]|nr:hypothetical protein FACS1894137_13260 [Spirochaetia bacterium]
MKKIEKLTKPITALAAKNNPDVFLSADGMLNLELFTQAGAAQWAATITGGRLLYADALGWMVYDDDTGAFSMEYGAAALQGFLRFFTKLLLNNISRVKPCDQEIAFKFCKALQTRSCLDAVASLMRHEPAVFCLPSDFDKDDTVINCRGLVVGIDGSTREATPEDRFTMSAPIRPEPGEPAEFTRFLNWAACGNDELKDWLLTACGVALYGHSTDRITNFYGTGRNGKGTLLRALFSVMGSYAITLPRSVAIKEPGQGSRFDIGCLPGKRAAILFDLKPDHGRLNLDILKSVCGNGDQIFVEKKGKDGYSTALKCKVFLASNDKIPIESYGNSEKRRFRLVPFNATAEAIDETLEARFIPEFGKILNLFIEYAVKYYANGRNMPQCKAIEAATDDYFDSQDLIKQFLEDTEAFTKTDYEQKTEFYTKFEEYCGAQQGIRRPIKAKSFTNELEKRGIIETVKKIDGKATRVFLRKVTRLQKNLNFILASHEANSLETNMNFNNSCNRVTETTETGPYETEEQRQIWETGEVF